MSELERYKEAVEYLTREMIRMHKISGARVRDDVEKILNPQPVYEEVTVERWECPKCGAVHKPEDHRDYCCNIPRSDGISLTGTRRVQVAQKVERSVSVEAHINGFGNVFSLNGDSLFSEHPEVHRKTGTLTFMVKE